MLISKQVFSAKHMSYRETILAVKFLVAVHILVKLKYRAGKEAHKGVVIFVLLLHGRRLAGGLGLSDLHAATDQGIVHTDFNALAVHTDINMVFFRADGIKRRRGDLLYDPVAVRDILKGKAAVLTSSNGKQRVFLGKFLGIRLKQAHDRAFQLHRLAAVRVLAIFHTVYTPAEQVIGNGLTLVYKNLYQRRLLTRVFKYHRVLGIGKDIGAVCGALLHIVAAKRQVRGKRSVISARLIRGNGNHFQKPACRNHAAIRSRQVIGSIQAKGNILVFLAKANAKELVCFAAGGKDTTPPTLTAVLDGETVKIESSDDNSGVEAVYIDKTRVNSLVDGKASVSLKDYAGTDKKVSVYAVDYAGNRSDTVKFDNPYYKEPAPTEKPAAPTQQSQGSTPVTKPAQTQAASSGSTGTGTQSGNSGSSNMGTVSGGTSSQGGSSGNTGNSNGSPSDTPEPTTSSVPDGAFTPEGTGTVLDSATGEDGDKQFYTITTEAGNVFYLIIDGKRDDNNVYFLNGVTEADLMALAEKGDGSVSVIPAADVCTCKEKCEAGNVNTGCPVCKNDLNGCIGKEKPAEPEEPAEPEQPKKDTGSVGTIIFIIVALLAVGGVGYYVKIVRPKQQAADEDEFDEDDGYGEGFDPDEAYGEPEYLSEDDFEDSTHEDGE